MRALPHLHDSEAHIFFLFLWGARQQKASPTLNKDRLGTRKHAFVSETDNTAQASPRLPPSLPLSSSLSFALKWQSEIP